MNFNELLALVSSKDSPQLCVDSRLVKPGDVFLAVKGTVFDGHDFIDQALANGAEYIVSQKRPQAGQAAEIIVVEDSSKAAAVLAQTQMGEPASKLTNLAVTGTNGKTTVAFLVRSCLQKAGYKCGLIGTVLYDTGLDAYAATLTTPDCLAIARMQKKMLEAGSKYMVIEASSHALSQNRLAAINFKAAAFTNLSGDHLDYHKTKADYLAAKSTLFESLSSDSTAVLNKQSPEAAKIARKTNAEVLWYAVDQSTDLAARIESMNTDGTSFIIDYKGRQQKVHTPLLGRYNIGNHLAAAGLCIAAGLDLETIAAGLSESDGIPGRLEKINSQTGFSVIVDYAHTDDALKNVLAALKPICKARLIVVFGCGGDRDRTKRPRMAKVAEELADIVIVTSDNPRTEEPAAIIGEIVIGFAKPTADHTFVEMDRERAIELAVKIAQNDDIVLIAGKGHETYQIIGQEKFDFSDKEIAEKYLRKIK